MAEMRHKLDPKASSGLIEPMITRFAAALLALSVVPVLAQDPLQDAANYAANEDARNRIVMQTLDLTAQIPAPPWTELSQIAATSETERQRRLTDRGTDLFLNAYVPKGQDFENWEELYAVKAEAPLSGDAEEHRNRVAKAYRAACVNAILAPVQTTAERQVFILFCPSYNDEPERGEYTVMVYTKEADTLVEVFYTKRVPAFDVNDRDSLPSTKDELRGLVRYLSQATVSRRKGA